MDKKKPRPKISCRYLLKLLLFQLMPPSPPPTPIPFRPPHPPTPPTTVWFGGWFCCCQGLEDWLLKRPEVRSPR